MRDWRVETLILLFISSMVVGVKGRRVMNGMLLGRPVFSIRQRCRARFAGVWGQTSIQGYQPLYYFVSARGPCASPFSCYHVVYTAQSSPTPTPTPSHYQRLYALAPADSSYKYIIHGTIPGIGTLVFRDEFQREMNRLRFSEMLLQNWQLLFRQTHKYLQGQFISCRDFKWNLDCSLRDIFRHSWCQIVVWLSCMYIYQSRWRHRERILPHRHVCRSRSVIDGYVNISIVIFPVIIRRLTLMDI